MESELLAVAQALDQSRDRQFAALERERLFGANLAHELRTPLTAIRTDAELLVALSGVPDGVTRRGARIVTAVDRINALANSLLLLARDARPVSSEQIDLKMALLEVWSSLQLAAPNGSGLQLDIPENYMLQADPALLDLVLRNVLDNAQRYNDEGDIRCELNGSVLRISDNGQGFADEDLARIFDRYYIGSRGVNGLGLALVQHICQACSWQVIAGNSAHGGGWVSIDLAASVLAA
jgi:signal transduction histidine kinase